MKRKWKILVGVGVVFAAIVYGVFGPKGITSVAHETARLHLRMFGESIYEYHAKTGQWPARAEDFAGTRMTIISPHWRSMLDSGAIVIVWRNDLKPEPRENANAILAYYDTGLISSFGRKWVCWGDLRTEYVKTDQLHVRLPARN